MSIEIDPTAVMGRRIGAVLIDGAIIYLPLWIYVGSQFEYLEQGSTSRAEDYCDTFNDRIDDGMCVAIDDRAYFDRHFGSHLGDLSAFAIVGAFLLYVVLQSLTGASIGKHLTGIRVVDEQGNKASFGKMLVRWVMWIVDGLPLVLGPLVGLITSLTTTGHRRVGDMVAKTHVVRKSSVGHPVTVGHHSLAGPSSWSTGMPTPTAKPGPQWDEARGTYIQWDPDAQAWMQWDDATKAWNPIPAAPAIPPPPVSTPAPPPPPPPPSAPPPPPPPSG